MSMKVAARQVDGVTILVLSGRITLGEGSVTLRDAVHDVIAKGSKHILLNLESISYIDSSGIGELVSAIHLGQELQVASSNLLQPHQEGPRSAPDHQALYRLRHLGQRSLRRQRLQINRSGCTCTAE